MDDDENTNLHLLHCTMCTFSVFRLFSLRPPSLPPPLEDSETGNSPYVSTVE